MLYSVIASNISRIDTGVVWRLQTAGSGITPCKDSVAVGTVDEVTAPGGQATVAIPQMGFTAFEKLVGKLEVKVEIISLRKKEGK